MLCREVGGVQDVEVSGPALVDRVHRQSNARLPEAKRAGWDLVAMEVMVEEVSWWRGSHRQVAGGRPPVH